MFISYKSQQCLLHELCAQDVGLLPLYYILNIYNGMNNVNRYFMRNTHCIDKLFYLTMKFHEF